MHVSRRAAVRDDCHGFVRCVGRIVFDLDVEHRSQTTQALRPDAQRIDLFKQLHAKFFRGVAGSIGLQFVHVQGFHQGLLGQQHGFFRRAANADAQNTRGTPTSAHGGYDAQNPVHNGVRRIQHGKLRLSLATAALGRHFNFHRIAGHDLGVDHGRGVVLGVGSGSIGVSQYRTAQHIIRMGIPPAYAFVNHVFEGHVRIPLHVHTNRDQHVDDAGVLANRSLANGAHARIYQHLSERSFCGGRLFFLPRSAHGAYKIRRVVIRNELQCVGDALNQIILLDNGH